MNSTQTTSKITADRIRKYLKQGKRFDGRKLEEFREIIIETGVSKNAEGSARVKIGKTDVLVGVKMDVSTPYADSANKGNINVGSELLPTSSPRVENGPPKFNSIEIARVLDRGIRESKFIDLEKLCIKEGEKVWTVYIDVYSLNDDGNVLDAAGIGAVAALKTAKMPKYNKETGKTMFGEWTNERIPLSKNAPVSITFYKIGENIIVDPTLEEEDIIETRVTLGLTKEGISSMQKGERESLTMEEMNKIMDLSEKVSEEVFKKIEKQLK